MWIGPLRIMSGLYRRGREKWFSYHNGYYTGMADRLTILGIEFIWYGEYLFPNRRNK